MKITYYLNDERKKNLYCRISDGSERVTFSLEHAVNPDNWNAKKEEIDFENEYYFTLMDFKKYLTTKYHEFKLENKDDILERLKNEALSFSKDEGLEGIAKNMFNYFNREIDLPKYEEFVQAFEKFSDLKKGEYKVQSLGEVIHFHTSKKKTYEIDTHEGLKNRLKTCMEKRFYDEIYTETNVNIWSEIYLDGGFGKSIAKSEFIPKMLNEWEFYFAEKCQNILKNTGNATNLNVLKQESWRHFQVYMECYDEHGDAIKLAYEIDDMELYPIAVFTMLELWNADSCFDEYCDLEFEETNSWESVELNEDDDNSPVFYIRECEL